VQSEDGFVKIVSSINGSWIDEKMSMQIEVGL
jgi:hypothetical protein